MIRSLLGVASRGGEHGRLSVLIFHRVLPRVDALFPEEVDAARFDTICGWLRAWFNVLPLDDAARRLQDGTLPARALAISFDDGYADNHDVALPILRRHGLPATFFIATGFLDGGRMWNDSIIEAIRLTTLPVIDLRGLVGPQFGRYAVRTTEEKRAAIGSIIPRAKHLASDARQSLADGIAGRASVLLPDDLMMTSEQVVALHRAGMQIGAHTVTHPILALLDAEEARAEIAAGKLCLEQLLGTPVRLFAYPNGRPGEDYTAQSVAIARELGFDAAMTTAWGASGSWTDRFEIPRFTPWDRTRTRFGFRLVRNLWSSKEGHPPL